MAPRCRAAVSIPCSLLVLSLLGGVSTQGPIEAFHQWFQALGGWTQAEIKVDSRGIRGLYASKDIPEGGTILRVPSSAILNLGTLTDSFTTNILNVLREYMHPNSRFKPYINTWPQPDEVVNQHNLEPQYWRMLKSPYWERELLKWLRSAQALAEGTWDPALPLTIPEAVGHVAVSQADVEHVSAIIASRSLGVFGRNLSLLVPLVDMANHAPACPHYLSAWVPGASVCAGGQQAAGCGMGRGARAGFEDEPRGPERGHSAAQLNGTAADCSNCQSPTYAVLSWGPGPPLPDMFSSYDGRRYLDLIAGAPIKAGQEVCYDYGDLRDDYAVAHYGFLPDLRGQPPRLSLVDHPVFDPAARHTPNSLPDTPFAGSPAEVEREVGRLLQIHLAITSTPDPLPAEAKGQWVYGMLKELESRRLQAIEAEVTRLARELDAASPGSVLDWEEGRGAKAVRTVCVGSNCWRTLPGGRWEVWVPEGGGKTEL